MNSQRFCMVCMASDTLPFNFSRLDPRLGAGGSALAGSMSGARVPRGRKVFTNLLSLLRPSISPTPCSIASGESGPEERPGETSESP